MYKNNYIWKKFASNYSFKNFQTFTSFSLRYKFSDIFKFQRNYHSEVFPNKQTLHQHENFKPLKVREFPQHITKQQFDSGNYKKFHIYRNNPTDGVEEYVSYNINLKECGPMILDALIKIKDHIDPTLSFRRYLILNNSFKIRI